MGVLIGVRVLRFVEEQLDLLVSSKYLWSDLKCTLFWINSKKQQCLFVENRLKEIRKHKFLHFRYVPTSVNPADLPTRGMSVEELTSSDLWLHGSAFLLLHQEDWPKNEELNEDVCAADEAEATVLSVNCIKNEFECSTPFGIEVTRISSLNKLLKVTAIVGRFIGMLRKNKTKYAKNISLSELNIAIQKHSYSQVLQSIQGNQKHHLVKQLNLYIEDDVIRCGGRLSNADLNYDEKYPILLPKKYHFTKLIIKEAHLDLLHAGVRQTLMETRRRYWIPHGRTTVQEVVKKCLRCRKYEGPPYSSIPMPPLPKERVTEGYPFACTGLDNMGPLFVKEMACNKKVWICLFTCLVTRAVHLELVFDLTTEEFLLPLRRFVSRRGKPEIIISDNVSTKTLQSAWSKVLHDPSVQDYASKKGINWKFITEYAPWMGGFYERMVGTVKRSLHKTMDRICLSSIQLQTIVAEVEAVINSRPLTYGESNIDDNKLLTPAHFLYGSPKIGLPNVFIDDDPDFTTKDTSSDVLIEKWKRGQNILNNYWKCWKSDYLRCLRERHTKTSKINQLPKERDVILIGEKLPRAQWKMGIIQSLIQSRDFMPRAAVVRLVSGKNVQRPIINLYPLECHPTENPDKLCHIKQSTKSVIAPKEESLSTRVQRRAAMTAKLSIKKLLRPECHDNVNL